MKQPVEYIFGKHAVREVLRERPDVVVEVHAAADFSGEDILALAESQRIPLKVLNLKNPPRGISSNAAASTMPMRSAVSVELSGAPELPSSLISMPALKVNAPAL